MKNKSFLYREFKLWFGCWFILLLPLGLLIYSRFSPELGKLLLTFSGTILIALLTAMAAFHNMDVNEQKKQARDEYKAHGAFIHSLQERYYTLRGFRPMLQGVMNSPSFLRGLNIPYMIMRTRQERIDFNQLGYLSRSVANVYKYGEELPKNYQCLNVVYLTQLEMQFESLMQLIDRRNQVMETKISSIFNKVYIGEGRCRFPVKFFKDEMSYSEFTNFLYLTEQILDNSDQLLRDLKRIINDLNFHVEKIIDKEVAKENGGFLKLHLPDDECIDLKVKYRSLDGIELERFNAVDYPELGDVSSFQLDYVTLTEGYKYSVYSVTTPHLYR